MHLVCIKGIDLAQVDGFLSVKKDAGRIVAERALGTLDQVDPTVRPGRNDVMLEHDRAAISRLDQRDVHVAADIFFLALGVVGGHFGVAVFRQRRLPAAHRDQPGEAVAVVDVHIPRHRAQAVSGI